MGVSMPDKRERATSFGAIAEDYDRFRPGPTAEVVDWLLPANASTVVDLGAGTGALTRLLVDRVEQVFSIEPDDRMRAFLAEHIPAATALPGRGDAIPLANETADAVLVSSAWHWMDVEPTLAEIARVLRLGGTLGVVWSGPDRRVPWLRRWLALGRHPDNVATGIVAALPDVETTAGPGAAAGARERHRFSLPAGAPFTEPEVADIQWSRMMTIDDLVGLASTYSTVITLQPAERDAALAAAKAWLEAEPELGGGRSPIELPFRALCWRTTRALADT